MKPHRTTAELLERATAHHRAGRPREAEAFYRKVLARKPQHEQGLFMLSGLLFEAGRFQEASLFLERLVAAAPPTSPTSAKLTGGRASWTPRPPPAGAPWNSIPSCPRPTTTSASR